MYVYGYTGYACTVCVIWYDDFRLIYTCVIWSYVICVDFVRDAWLEFLYVVLNTTCDCIWYYVMWILVLCYTVMCVYVDNYVDNFNINVDNFFVAFATLLRTFFENIVFSCVFAHYLLLSLICSCFLTFSLYCYNSLYCIYNLIAAWGGTS